MSLIEEGPEPQVRMAYLAIVGSFSVNGVAALHSRAAASRACSATSTSCGRDKFNNKTNGVTPRRWLAAANPALARADHRDHRRPAGSPTSTSCAASPPHADDPAFRARWREVKRANKVRLAELVRARLRRRLSIRTRSSTCRSSASTNTSASCSTSCTSSTSTTASSAATTADWTPRCVLIGGKAAPGYFMAKRIIKLISKVAEVVNDDPEVGGRLKVAFLPNYRVSAMEVIAPGTDLSEQISTAGKEASGTGNMKFMMNGARDHRHPRRRQHRDPRGGRATRTSSSSA